jgi:hypothetical protein
MARQGQTAQGAMVRLQNQWELFKETAGEGLLSGLKAALGDLANWLDAHKEAVQRFAFAVGEGFGWMLSEAMRAATWIYNNLGPPVVATINLIAGAWQAAQPLIATAIGVIERLIATIGTFLQQQVLPVVYQAIGQITQWWDAHSTAVATILGVIFGNIGTFFSNTQSGMESALTTLQGVWDVGWGALSGLLGLILDVMTGNWQLFGSDLVDMSKTIVVGLLEVFAGLEPGMIRFIYGLQDPLNALLHGLYQWSTAVGTVISSAFDALEAYVGGLFDHMTKALGNFLGGLATGPIGQALSIVDPAKADLLRAAAGAVVGLPTFGAPSLSDLITGLRARIAIDQAPGSRVSQAQRAHEAAMLAFAQAAFAHGETLTQFIAALRVRVGLDTADARAGSAAARARLGWEEQLLRQAEAGQKAQAAQLPPFALGLPPEAQITFIDPDKAIRDFNAQIAPVIQAVQDLPNPFAGKKAPTFDTSAWQAGGKKWADTIKAWLLSLEKTGIKLPAFDPKKFELKFPTLTVPPPPDITGPGALKGKSPAEQAVELARSKLALDIAHPATLKLATVLSDVAAIMKAERALPASQRPNVYQLALDAITYTKDGMRVLLDESKKRLDLDIANHADAKRLRADEAAYLKLYALGPDITKTDIAYEKKQIDDAIASALGAGASARTPVAPVPRYGALAGETGYGQVTVSFGGAQVNPLQAIVAELRAQLAFWKQRAERDEHVIALLETGNATESAQLGVLRGIEGHTRPGPPPPPARSAHSALKAAGSYAPVTR